MVVQQDLRYAEVGKRPLSFDLFRADDSSTLPLVVMIHGGGWISGDRYDFLEEAQVFAAAGFAAATVEYRLAPLHPYPAAVADVMAFVRYARGNAAELGIDPERIGAMGVSAGGHLAAMLGVAGKRPTADDHTSGGETRRIQAVVDLCGITDITHPEGRHFPVAWEFLRQFMGCAYSGNEETWREASPLCHVTPEAASFLIMHGREDDIVPLEQSHRLKEALEGAGVQADLHVLPGEGHGFTHPTWLELRGVALEFLSNKLRV
jgi:acetyl esterase/lipase